VATYYDIFGQKVQYLASDPNPVQIGQVWYNSTSNTAKFEGVSLAAWASAASMPNGLSQMAGGGATNSGVTLGGDTGGGYPGWPTATQEFDGTSWSGGGNTPYTATGIAVSGTDQPTLLMVGGSKNGPVTNETASYNGSAWSGETVYPASIANACGFGAQTASVFFGGGTGTPGGTSPFPTSTSEYDGSSWTAGGAMPTGRFNARGTGILTAGLSVGSSPPTPTETNVTIEYDGSSWTSGGSLSQAGGGGAATGTITAAFYFGRGPSPDTATEQYNGTSWTASASLSNSHPGAGGFGTNGISAIIGGFYPGVGTTEEFTGVGPETKTITTS
jgi:hypothetical protein